MKPFGLSCPPINECHVSKHFIRPSRTMVFDFFGNFSLKASIDLCTVYVGSVMKEETSHSCRIWDG